MPRQHPRPRRKTRTREHVIADLSVNYTERPILLCGYSLERIKSDYGLDLLMFTYGADGGFEDGVVFLQVNATDGLKRPPKGGSIPFRVERADLEYWASQLFPVILVVYDAQSDVAYWVYVQAYMEALPPRRRKSLGATVTLPVPLKNVLTVDAVRRFAQFKESIQAQTKGVIHHHE